MSESRPLPAAIEVIRQLGLRPLDFEGGWYAETWRSGDVLPGAALPARYGSPRAAGTAIYFLLTPDTFSKLHRLKSDELFHFYLGDPVEMLQLHPNGRNEILTIGPDLAGGERPQIHVPAGSWQGCRLKPGGRLALMGCTVAPGFDRADFEAGDPVQLTAEWPAAAEWIRRLTEPA